MIGIKLEDGHNLFSELTLKHAYTVIMVQMDWGLTEFF